MLGIYQNWVCPIIKSVGADHLDENSNKHSMVVGKISFSE
jgi:hypothetical protein